MIRDYVGYVHDYLITLTDSVIQQIPNEQQYKTNLLSTCCCLGSDLVLG